MLKNIIVFTALALISLSVVYLYFNNHSTKIAYVNTAKVLEEFQGMKDAQAIFKDKTERWQSNFDTLKMDYSRALNQFELEKNDLTEREIKRREELLKKQQVNLQNFANSLEQKAMEEDGNLTNGVLEQVNIFTQEYCQELGYDLVIGLTNEGNVLYVDDKIDITNAIINKLNSWYQKDGKI